MAIFRVDDNLKAYLVKGIPAELEDEFIAANSTGKIRFVKVSQFPPCEVEEWIFDPQSNEIKVDITNAIPKLRERRKKQLSQLTDNYIFSKLKEHDESLDDIATELKRLEAYIVYQLSKVKDPKKPVNFTLVDLDLLAAKYIANEISLQDIEATIDKLNITDEAKANIKAKLPRIVELINFTEWKERIWELENQLEDLLEKLDDLDKIRNFLADNQVLSKYDEISKKFGV